MKKKHDNLQIKSGKKERGKKNKKRIWIKKGGRIVGIKKSVPLEKKGRAVIKEIKRES